MNNKDSIFADSITEKKRYMNEEVTYQVVYITDDGNSHTSDSYALVEVAVKVREYYDEKDCVLLSYIVERVTMSRIL